MTTHESLEHQEHAEHAAAHGSKRAALLIAVLAAALAICEQQAKKAEIAVQEQAILTADAWAQYQAKSIRAAVAQDLQRIATIIVPPTETDLIATRASVLKELKTDQVRYETDAKDGKQAIADRARALDAQRQESLERDHTFDNAAAALELGIVLATASVITSSGLLIRFAFVLGTIGFVLGVLGVVAPSLGAL
jgi:RES domain-containing protein